MEALNIKEIPMTEQQKQETQSLQVELRKDPVVVELFQRNKLDEKYLTTSHGRYMHGEKVMNHACTVWV